MHSSKEFTFVDDTNKLTVIIPEVVEAAYGMYVWPSAPVLAQYVWYNRKLITNKYVLEIGAGTALPGIVAAKCGAYVSLSDSAKFPRCLENCRKSCEANSVHDVPLLAITWGEFTPDLLNLSNQDIVLGSDCFYATKDFEDVLVTAAYILDQNPHAVFWTTYQERSADRSIEELLMKWQLQCKHIPLSLFDADTPDIAGSKIPGPHTIHMLVITRRKDTG